MSDLSQLPLEQLAALPEWMVPPGRKSELEAYLAKKRRGDDSPDRSPEEQQREVEEARVRAGLNRDGTPREQPRGSPGPMTKRGPRGGRYTEARTRDGRPYRRYF